MPHRCKGQYQTVINLQGDLPELDPALLEKLANLLRDPEWDLTTLAAPATDDEAAKSQIVKAVVSFTDQSRRVGRALYFSRAAVQTGQRVIYTILACMVGDVKPSRDLSNYRLRHWNCLKN